VIYGVMAALMDPNISEVFSASDSRINHAVNTFESSLPQELTYVNKAVCARSIYVKHMKLCHGTTSAEKKLTPPFVPHPIIKPLPRPPRLQFLQGPLAIIPDKAIPTIAIKLHSAQLQPRSQGSANASHLHQRHLASQHHHFIKLDAQTCALSPNLVACSSLIPLATLFLIAS